MKSTRATGIINNVVDDVLVAMRGFILVLLRTRQCSHTVDVAVV